MTQLPVFEGGNRTLDEAADSRLRLQTIVRLRWFAIIGQTLAVAVVALLFRFPMPVGYCLAFITLSAWLNVYLRVRYTGRHRLSATFATVLLGYDVLQLAALLYLTGGIENPFIVLMVAPVTVSAATLPPRNTILLGALALAAAGLLTTEHMALPWDGGVQLSGPLALPILYKLGVLLAFACSLIFLALYAWRLSKELRQMSAALSATEMVLAHEQKLHALDGLAAAAAHELGTPLATIVLVTKELARELPPSSPHGEDIELLRSQAQRCREILQKLTRHPSEQDPMHAAITVTQLLDEVVDPLRASKVAIVIDAGPTMLQEEASDGAREPVAERNPGVLYGLGNLLENAVDFAQSRVEVTARWSNREVTVTIADDGRGFSPEILETIGEPYVTTRPAGRQGGGGHDAGGGDVAGGGLGLGFFIAKTLLERSGAQVAFGNRTGGQSGAVVRVGWPRELFEKRAASAVSRLLVGNDNPAID